MSCDESHLQQALSIWTAAFEHLSDGIVVCDPSDNLLLVNQALRDMIGLNADAPLPKDFSDLSLEQYDASCSMSKNYADAKHYTIGGRILRCTRSPALNGNGHMIGSVLVLHDITAEADNKHVIHQLFATISSELRTPLTPIFIQIDLLLRGFSGSINEEQKMMLQQIRQRTEDINDIVKDSIMVANIEADTLTCDPEPLSLQHLVQEIIQPKKALFIDKHIDLQTEIFSDLPHVFVDGSLTRIILDQLLDNAYRFTQHGSVIIRAHEDGTMIRVNIIDSGIGVPQESQIDMFKPFFHVPQTNVRQGSGLGLYIVRELVELQGGRVWVESTLGQGSTFSFTVPQAAPYTNDQNE